MHIHYGNRILAAVLSAALLISCSDDTSKAPNTLSEKEVNEGWQLLFDGKSTDQWHIYNKGDVASAWVVRNGELYCDPANESAKGDLITNKEFKNYELRFDWKLEKEGNSGVFVNVQEDINIPATWNSGPEYQLLEDSHPDYDKPLKRAGCLYTFTPQLNFVNTKASGQWNTSKIIQQDGQLAFYLNDVQTAAIDLNSQKWKDMVKNSDFRAYEQFGAQANGRIALQDWSRGVSFRNIKIKEL